MPDAVDLAYSIEGPSTGPVILLLHGFPLSKRMWRHQVKALAADGWRVVTPDLRGHGASPRPDESATMQRQAADVRRLADTLGLDAFVLAGFSMGGYVALQLALESPARVRGLALIDTRADADTDEARARRYATAEDVKARGVAVVADAMLPKMLTERTRGQRPELADEVRDMMMRAPQTGVVQALLGMAARPDQRPHLAKLQMPALVLVGSEDAVTPRDAAEVLAKGMPDARLEVIPDAAHLSPMEQPEAVTSALRRWLKPLSSV